MLLFSNLPRLTTPPYVLEPKHEAADELFMSQSNVGEQNYAKARSNAGRATRPMFFFRWVGLENEASGTVLSPKGYVDQLI